jgi:hypothetical protein
MSFAVSSSPRLFSSRYARRQSMWLFTLTPLTGGLPILSRRRILATQIALTALARSFGACVASTTSATAKRPQKGILAEMRAGVRGFAAKLAGGVDPRRHVRPLGDARMDIQINLWSLPGPQLGICPLGSCGRDICLRDICQPAPARRGPAEDVGGRQQLRFPRRPEKRHSGEFLVASAYVNHFTSLCD